MSMCRPRDRSCYRTVVRNFSNSCRFRAHEHQHHRAAGADPEGRSGARRDRGGPVGTAPSGALPKSQLVEIKSPMVGTFYAAPEPGAEPYIKAGSRVATGQVVCIIEAMKIMNEIEAEVAGLVREVCVENAQPVEFGQPLFRVDPHA